MALRALSFLFGRQITQELKRRLIFKEHGGPCFLVRRIVVEPHRILVVDCIEHLPEAPEIVRAQRASKRYVASADSFHEEDLALLHGAGCEQTTRQDGSTFSAQTVYSFPDRG